MTVTTQNQDVTYDGDGSTIDFPIPFYFLRSTDIRIDRIDSNGALTPLVYGTDFLVSGAGDENGGAATTTATYAAGTKLHIYRIVPVTQETEYQQNDPFPAKSTEKALDKLTMIAQQHDSAIENSIRYPLNEYGRDGTLPVAADRALKVLGFDDQGRHTMLPMPAGVGAGDMRNEMWTDGVDYTAGTSTSVTLSRTYTSKANLGVVIMAGVPQDPASYDLIDGGTTLQFDTPIPAFIGRIWCYGGTTLSLNTPAAQSVTDSSIAPGSALYDRIANNFNLTDPQFAAADFTAQVQKALDFVGARGGGVVHVPDGVNGIVSRSIYFNYPRCLLWGNNRATNTFKAQAGAAGIDVQAMFKILADDCGLINIGADGDVSHNLSYVFGAVWSDGRVRTRIENCYLRNFIGDGITLYSNSGSSKNSDFVIQGNRLENFGWGGISVFYGVTGKIVENSVISCGTTAIRTDGIVGNLDAGVSFGIDITQNYVNRGTPPTVVRGGGLENGFMIAYGAGDQFISVQDNFCFDNRNAAEDGIGLGQDGIHNNIGCIVQGNIVAYAGLFGIDATNESTVVDNIILFSTQCGIKVGTDAGGNCTSVLIKDNLIVNPNNPSARFPAVQDMGIHVATNSVPAVYSGIRISGNKVIDYRSGAAQLTKYGLVIGFVDNLTFTNNDFSDNDFTGVGTDGAFASGGLPRETGWTYSNNKHPTALKVVTGAILNVFGHEKVTVQQVGATTVTDILGGFDGCDLSVQHNDGNTTWKFNSNPNMYGNTNTNLTPVGGNWMKFERYNGAWAGYRTVQ